MTVKNTFTAGTDIVAATMNENFATLPWAMQIATANITGNGTLNLTANRFHSTLAPAIFLTCLSGNTTRTSATFSTPTYSAGVWSIPIYVWAGGAASTTATTVQVFAVQQTSTTAVG
jgi:hypothetical protein